MSKGWLRSLRKGLRKTSKAIGLSGLLSAKLDEDFWEDLEDRLIISDLSPAWVSPLIDELRSMWEDGDLKTSQEILPLLRAKMLEGLGQAKTPSPSSQKSPAVWFFLGVNGVGKTTSLGKLGQRLSQNGFQLIYGAGDTFRAAAAEQLTIWGERAKATVIRHREGGDPSAVVFDAHEAALKRKVDYLLLDTAGRLHNKKNLMAECAKMFRIVERQDGHIEEVFLVLDATTGQNAVQQAKLFSEVAPLTGLILTKMDGTAKGGVAIRLVQESGVPIRYLGVGEGVDDLIDFDPEAYVDSILTPES